MLEFNVLVPVLELGSDGCVVVDCDEPCALFWLVESGVTAPVVPVLCGQAEVPPALLPCD